MLVESNEIEILAASSAKTVSSPEVALVPLASVPAFTWAEVGAVAPSASTT